MTTESYIRILAGTVVLTGLALGVEVVPGSGEDSGLHGALLRAGTLEGAADPRREGVAESL